MDKLDTKKKVIMGLAIIAVSFGAGIFAKPSKVIVETKEVVKTVIVKGETKIKIVDRVVTVAPDGTRTEVEHSREDSASTEHSVSQATKEVKSTTTNDIGLTLSALAIADTSDITGHRDYGIHVTKRVLGNVNVGVMATLDKKVGVSIGLSF